MTKNFLINGDSKKTISPFDRGLAFGDGVFRTFLVEDSNPRLWSLQYNKLSNDLKSIGIKCPSNKVLLKDIKNLFPQEGIYIGKIIVTRGESLSGYDFTKTIKPTRILLKIDFDQKKYDAFQKGVHLSESNINVSEASYSSIKHLNRLENVLARKGLNKKFFDVIMIDDNKNVCDCARSSLFVRYGTQLFTPNNKNSGISGVTKFIIEKNIKKLNLTMSYNPIKLEQLKKADEVIVSNSVFGALPVLSFKNKKWDRGNLANLVNNILNESK